MTPLDKERKIAGSTEFEGADSQALIAASFGRAADSYHEFAHIQKLMAAWLSEWLPDAHTGRALELGAGPGIFTNHLLPWSGKLTVTDLSETMCVRGRQQFPNLDWHVMDARHPGEEQWDWIFSSSMLQWLPDPEETLSKLCCRLRPGGRLLMGVFVAGSLCEWRSISPAKDPFRWRSINEWRDTLKAAGLKLARDSTCWKTVYFSSARAALRSLHETGTAPIGRVNPVTLRKTLAEYERRYRSPSGIPASWYLYRFEAQRAAPV